MATFAGLIAIGTVLLALPIAGSDGSIGILNAFFTATSAVCVTGLTVVDTGSGFSLFGQWVILILFQLGGLGIMTFAALATQIFVGKLSLRSQESIGDTFYQGYAATHIRRDLFRIVLLTFVLETIGAAVIYHEFDTGASPSERPLFFAAFHSVAAFCNSGFVLYRNSLMSFGTSPVLVLTIMMLIFLGGIGHRVILESLSRAWRFIRGRRAQTLRWSLHSRIALWMSAALTFGGALLLMPFLSSSTHHGFLHTAIDALFQSVSCRTAGFSTVNLSSLSATTILIMCVLMFIGGSPGSCAGGVKTTTVVTWFAQLYAWLTGRRDVTLMGRRLPTTIVAKAAMIIGLGVLWIGIGSMFLTLFEQGRPGMTVESLFFE